MAPPGVQVTRYGFGQPQALSRRLPAPVRPLQRTISPAGLAGRPQPLNTSAFSSTSGAGGGAGFNAAFAPRMPPPQPTGVSNVQQTQQANQQASQGLQTQYEADPILQQIRALGRADVGTARSSASAGRNKLLTEYGDETFARDVLKHSMYAGQPGVGDDDPIFKAIRENPFSITKTIAKDRERSTAEAEDAFNKQNLFYGGARIKGLGDLEQSFLQRGTEAQSGIRGKLDEIEQALLQVEQESLGRQLDYLMTNPYGGGYGGSGDVGGYDEGDRDREPPPERVAVSPYLQNLYDISRRKSDEYYFSPAPPPQPRRGPARPIKTWFG